MKIDADFYSNELIIQNELDNEIAQRSKTKNFFIVPMGSALESVVHIHILCIRLQSKTPFCDEIQNSCHHRDRYVEKKTLNE